MGYGVRDIFNQAKLNDGLAESPTVMVGETKTTKNRKNRGILKPSWAFVETNNICFSCFYSNQEQQSYEMVTLRQIETNSEELRQPRKLNFGK